MAKFINLGNIAAALSRSAYQTQISTIKPDNWPTAGQPIRPIAPGSPSLIWPFLYSQNLTYTPRPDANYTSADLRQLATYPLARVCIDNVKDNLCQMPWTIELRKIPGESQEDVRERRKKDTKGDSNITKISRILERPDGEHDWSEWMRQILEDMLVADDAAVLIQRTSTGRIVGFEWTSGDPISVYIDDQGRRPKPPNPAYAQLWQGMPRTDLTSDQLVYKPRNIVPRSSMTSSYLYGLSPVESLADEIKVGMNRLAFVLAYYTAGSLGNMVHVVPPGIPPDKIKEAMQWVNSEMAGNDQARRQYRIIQGFTPEGKDQIEFPKEPVLADIFDDLHIRKICFGLGNSPVRLTKPMNRGSASQSQSAANEEGFRPWMDWTRRTANYLIQAKMGYTDYELVLSPYFESDYTKKSKADIEYAKIGALTLNDIRDGLGKDPYDNPLASQPQIYTPTGAVQLGTLAVANPGSGDGSTPAPKAPAPKQKVNGVALVHRGEM